MRNPRIYQPCPLAVGDTLTLDESGSRHIGKVLRMQAGGCLTLFNGEGGQYSANIIEVGKKTVSVSIESKAEANNASPLSIHLGQVMSRGDRMDYVIQKSVELGVDTITPLFSHRCEVKLAPQRLEKRLQQWQQQMISACEQCGLNRVPTINKPLSIIDWCQHITSEKRFILHPGDKTVSDLFQTDKKPTSVALAIGPEGGFDNDEIAAAEQHHFQCLALGPRVFRTETAPIVMLSLLQCYWGDF